MRYYSVPADFKKETIDSYERLNNTYERSKVIETYGNITVDNLFGSGRLVRQMLKTDIFDLCEYINYSAQKGIDYNYTFNATHIQNRQFTAEGIAEIKKFLARIYDAGVRSITVTLPSLIELVRASNLDFKIKTSTLCQVNNANKALFFKGMGVEKIVVEEAVNRNFLLLKSIREAFGEKVEIIVNQICDQNCVYRMFHYNMISGDPVGTANQVGTDYFEHRCVLQQLKSADNLLKLCWVRPEDIKYYTDIGIHYFKLQGRHTFVRGGDPVRTVKAYFDESFDGNLMDLLNMFAKLTGFSVYVDNKKLEGFIKPFTRIDNFCNNNCSTCRYCPEFAQKCIDSDRVEEVRKMAEDFYDNYDRYKSMVNSPSVETEKTAGAGESENDMEIDFEIE